jgi:hypothetical protein
VNAERTNGRCAHAERGARPQRTVFEAVDYSAPVPARQEDITANLT